MENYNISKMFKVGDQSELKKFFKEWGLSDEIINHPAFELVINDLLSQMSAIGLKNNETVDIDESNHRIKFSSYDYSTSNDKAYVYIAIGPSSLSFTFGTNEIENNSLKHWEKFTECHLGEFQLLLDRQQYGRSLVVDTASSLEVMLENENNKEKVFPSYSQSTFNPYGVETFREEYQGSPYVVRTNVVGKLNCFSSETYGNFARNNCEQKTTIMRDYFDTANVTIQKDGLREFYKHQVLVDEHGLEKMRVFGGFMPMLTPLSEEMIAKKISHSQIPVVREYLKSLIRDRDKFYFSEDDEREEKKGNAR